MNLKKSGKMLWIVAAVAMLAMVLQGCGGDDGVNPTTHMGVEEERDKYKADAERLQDELTTATNNLNTATTRIGMEPGADGMGGSGLLGDLATQTAMVASLTTRIGTAPDADGMGGSGLLGDLATQTAMVESLTTRIGMEPDADGMGGSGLLDDLATQMAMVESLTTQINGDGTPDNPGLTALLAAAVEQIGEAPGPDGMGGSGLLGDLATEMGKVTMYMEMINGDGTPENPGLQADLNAALETINGDGTDENPGLRKQLEDANTRIASLLKGEDPDQITPIGEAARTAADEAGTAATKAGEYADQAEMDDDNRATIQTGDANSVEHAKYARMQAEIADDEGGEDGKAGKAATMAEEATTTADANKYLNMATAAKLAAEKARDMAKEQAGMAKDDAMVELKIDGSTKSVGDTSITVNRQSHTSADGRTITGLLGNMDITQAGTRDAMGHLITVATSATDATPTPVQIGGTDLAAATVEIGVTYDSADDDARLTLVHSYLGSKKEMLFIRPGDTGVALTSAGVTPDPSPFVAAPPNDNTGTGLVPEPPDEDGAADTIPTGTVEVLYAQANAALGFASGSADELSPPAADAQTATRTATGVAGIPRMAGVIARAFDESEGTQPSLYYIDTGVTDNSTGADDDGIDQTRIFLERRVIGNTVTYDLVFVRQVTLDDAKAFEHIHYGLWNGISGRDANTVADLGIGFVTALADGDGMTAVDDMPNVGTVTYDGNWVANVQRAAARGDGEISRRDGSATIMANVENNEIDVTLTNLATLEGMIDGNTFSGTKATLADSNMTTDGIQAMYGLDGTGKFEGSFSGGFFGPRAAEAGGVFDFSTEDNHEGAFRGSFGGGR